MACFPLLLDPLDLLSHLDDPQLRLIDLGRLAVYRQVHIRGAYWLDGKRLMAGGEDGGKLPAIDRLIELCQQLGLHPDQSIVLYDDEGGGWAGRMLWTLHWLGFTRVSLLDGGIHGWLAAGLPTEEGEPPAYRSIPLNYALPTPDAQPQIQINRQQIEQQLADQTYALWDCRSLEEYTGERLAARRGGHLPHAIHYEWTEAMDKQHGLRLKPIDQIRQTLHERGMICGKPIVTYCQSHHRSGFAYALGCILGLDIRAYDGGFSEWGNCRDTPLTTGATP